MSSSVRRLRPSSHSSLGFAALCSLLAAGCSADVARFDVSTQSLAENGNGATLPPATEPVRERSNLMGSESGQGSSGGTYYPSPSNREPSVRRTELQELPPPATTSAIQPYSAGRSPPDARDPRYAAAPSRVAPERGELVEVQAGDTLYGLSRRYNVPVSELMAVNDMKSPSLKPGQKLYLPAGSTGRMPVAKSQSYETAAPASAPGDWTGSYTVKAGDSLYGIAHQHNVKVAEIERYNGITDVRKVKPGITLKVPGGSSTSVAAQDTTSATQPAARAPQTSAQPTIINSSGQGSGEERVAKLENSGSASDAAGNAPGAGSVAGSSKLRWPVAGKIISGFGPRADGTHNDGVNIAAPMGTDVHAAESGVVAYAGDELKGYGNLVLLRHDNGWVTAYAHGDEILVKRGDRIKRGQVIARAGRTGQVDQPQVHFELRQGQRPVDPTPFLERL